MTLDFLAIADIIIFFQGMLLAIFFLTNKSGNRYANVLLGLFIFTQHFGLLHSFFLNAGLTAKHPSLLSIPSFFLWWTGPLIIGIIKKYGHLQELIDQIDNPCFLLLTYQKSVKGKKGYVQFSNTGLTYLSNLKQQLMKE